MVLSVKAALAGVAVVGVGGLGLWLHYYGAMPKFSVLSEDTGYSDTSGDYKDKYAAKYARFLVGVATPAADKESGGNKAWWDWSFKYRYAKEKAAGGFKDLKSGSKSSEKDKSLQEACEKAYKSATDKIVTADITEEGTEKFKEDQVWSFCSFSNTKPKTLSDVANDDKSADKSLLNDRWKGEKWGEKKKEELLAIHDPANRDIWNHLNWKFKPFYAKSPLKDLTRRRLLEHLCEEAYAQTFPSTTKDNEGSLDAEIYKWCSLKGSKATAQ